MDRIQSIQVKMNDIEAQIAYAETMGWIEKAERQRERLALLMRAARMKPETAWKRALELGKRFVNGEGQRALEDALLYAYAATGRGLSDSELLAAVADALAKKKGGK